MLGIVFSCVLSLIIGISCIFSYFYLQANDSIELLYSFMRISSFDLTLGINIDILSTISGAIVSIITLCTYIYSIFYMDKENNSKAIDYFQSSMDLAEKSIQIKETAQGHLAYAESLAQICTLKSTSYLITNGLKVGTIAKKALKIASEICVFTNDNITCETL